MKRDRRFSLLRGSAGVLTVLVTCSSPTTSPTDAGSMGDAVGGDAATRADASSVPCTMIATGAPITPVKIAADAPAAAGGTVADGTYALTAFNTYTGVGGPSGPKTGTLAAVVQTAGDTWQYAISENGGPAMHETATVTFSGNAVNQTFICPPPSSMKAQDYTATSTELRLYTPRGTSSDEAVFTRP